MSKILIVDEETVASAMAKYLEDNGHIAYVATNGDQAQKAMEKRPWFYDIVISDVKHLADEGISEFLGDYEPCIGVIATTLDPNPEELSEKERAYLRTSRLIEKPNYHDLLSTVKKLAPQEPAAPPYRSSVLQ